jgi:predicted GIY-YIG superfamily endonuclease
MPTQAAPDFVVYVLRDVLRDYTYIGSTADLDRRILQHNGVYGRAQATKQTWGHCWEVAGYMSGFRTRPQALSFEYSWRRCCRRRGAKRPRPLTARMLGLDRLLARADGTQKWEGGAPDAPPTPLTWHALHPLSIRLGTPT